MTTPPIKKALLVISFGTSYNEVRIKNIEACEQALARACPDRDLYRAFTSKMIMKKLAERDQLLIDDPKQALQRLYDAGYRDIAIQSLHVINGDSYEEIMVTVRTFQDQLKHDAADHIAIHVGKPLLNSIDDYHALIAALQSQMPPLAEDERVVFMGHGAEHFAFSAYACLDHMLSNRGIAAIVGAVESYPEIKWVINRLQSQQIRKVHLMPLMIVAGDHAINDMASDEEDSWCSQIQAAGIQTQCWMQGLGENTHIQNLFVAHLHSALTATVETGTVKTETVETDRVNTPDPVRRKGKLYAIGTGPGHADLITLRGVNTLQQADVIYAPQGKKGGQSLALHIVQPYLAASVTIKTHHFPMTYDACEKNKAWDEIAAEIMQDVAKGLNVCFISLGDIMLYSTWISLLDRLHHQLDIDIIPGITSFSSIAACCQQPLAMETQSLVVVSATAPIDHLTQILQTHESIVIMKVSAHFSEIYQTLEKLNLIDHALLVSDAAMRTQIIYHDIRQVDPHKKLSYFTTLLINKSWSKSRSINQEPT